MRDRLLSQGQPGAVWLGQCTPSLTGWYRHRHDELEANLLLSGTGTYVIGDQRLDCTPRSLIWLFPGQEHQLLNRSEDFRMHILVWRPELTRTVAAHLTDPRLIQANPPGRWQRRISATTYRNLVHLVEDLAAITDRKLLELGLGWMLARCWNDFHAAPESAIEADLHPAVAEAVRCLRLGDDAQLDDVANRAGVSGSHLSRLFRKQLGLTPQEFRARERLERVLDRLASNGEGLMDAALGAGFGSYAQFHRVFHRIHGMSPRDWVKRRQEQG